MAIKDLYNKLETNEAQIAVIGLGYIGLPLLVELSNHFKLIGFDNNKEKIEDLKIGIDKNNEVKSSRFSWRVIPVRICTF